MSTSTFSGPIRAGTQRTGGVTAMNCGVVELAQSATITAAQMLTAPAAVNLFTLPAGAKITRIFFDVTVAITTATNVGITLGNVGGAANTVLTTFNTGTSVARVTQATVDAAMVIPICNNIGTADLTITATPTAATGNAAAGSIVVTIQYMQRFADGTTAAVA